MTTLPLTTPCRQVLVAGGGPVGLLTALALAQAGLKTVLVTPEPPPPGRGSEARTAALFTASLALLDAVGVWDACRSASVPLTAIRILDDRGGLLRAPEVVFAASEIGAAAFGYNVPNGVLAAELRGALRSVDCLTWIEGRSVTAVQPHGEHVVVELDDGRRIEATLVVGADGRGSVCRTGAGIEVVETAYDQVAVTTTFTHQRPHYGISTELHGPAGPCTTVPLPGLASSLVWVERPAIAARLLAMDDASFIGALEARLQGLLGALSAPAPRGKFPLAWMQADQVAARRVMLVGEAAHVMPPIGAQGLNLGLRDVGWAVECITDAAGRAEDIGGAAVLERYTAARASDIGVRMGAVDALNRSLLSDLAPLHLARGLGLHVIAASKALRQQLMTNGLAPSRSLPRIMRTAPPVLALDGDGRSLA